MSGAPSPPSASDAWTTVAGERAHAVQYGRSERGVILLHGLASDERELGPLPAAIAARGFTALAIDLRGHGKSEGARGVVSEERVLEDIMAWKHHLSQSGTHVVALGGHSLGGTWALAAARRIPVQGFFSSSAPATIRAEIGALELAAYRIGSAVHRFASRVGKRDLWTPYKVRPEDILDDAEAIARMRRDPIVQSRVPLANVDPLLKVDGAAWAREVTCPGLVCYATRDRVVGRENARAIYDAYAGPKEWRELAGPHSCFFDSTGDACSRVVADWLGRTLA